MARPKLPEDQLLHTRRTRKSTTKSSVLPGIKKPSARILKKWKPILDMCTKAVLSNESLNTLPIKNKVRLRFHKKPPKGFPHGRTHSKDGMYIVMEYNAEIVLTWMYERMLSPYSPSMLYGWRREWLLRCTRMENVVDSRVQSMIQYYSWIDEEVSDEKE